MQFASFQIEGRKTFGPIAGDGVVDFGRRLGPRFRSLLDVLRAGALQEAKAAAAGVRADYPLAQVQLLPPVLAPEKILCIGVNYAHRNEELRDNVALPKYPSLFLRTPGSLVGHGEKLLRPKVSDQFDYEGEFALIIGREARHLSAEDALSCVAGLTLCNEGSVRDWMRHGKFNVTQGKNFDASGSIGPWMVTSDAVDWSQPLHLVTRVNGEVRQDDTTASLIFSFSDILVYLTTFTTLRPGDVILTGTPTGAGARLDPPVWLVPGDVVEIESPTVGVLRNEVADEP
ncbi:MAG: fumarylacetoacetate hydrolase family protein [Variibacter sp.]|nr:fumarylacetoacetate hydrolase family protein [Variibacter sp.]